MNLRSLGTVTQSIEKLYTRYTITGIRIGSSTFGVEMKCGRMGKLWGADLAIWPEGDTVFQGSNFTDNVVMLETPFQDIPTGKTRKAALANAGAVLQAVRREHYAGWRALTLLCNRLETALTES